MTGLGQELRQSLRMLRRNPGFTLVAVLTLAIGIGVNATIFRWVDAILLHPLTGVEDPGRLVALETTTPGGDFVTNSYPDYIDFRDQLKLIDVAMTRPAAFTVGPQDHAERLWGELVSGNYFAVLGAKAHLGRVFLPSEYGDAPGGYPVAVISDRYWRSHLGADPAVVGKRIRVNQHELSIVGVASEDFHGSLAGEARDLWIPYMMQPELNGVEEWMLRDRKDRNMLGVARLKPGVTLEQAQYELRGLAGRMAVLDAATNEGMSATLLPMSKAHFGPQGVLMAPLKILMAVCGLVLLIVCANVANLLLVRTASRQKEFSTRLALGGSRGRLARQVLLDSLVLVAVGGVAGLAAAQWMSKALSLLLPSGQISHAVAFTVNRDMLLFTIGICALTTCLAGLGPALQPGHSGLSERMNEGGRSGSESVRTYRLRGLLVAAEVALALVAIIGAGLFARGFEAARQIDPGFDPNRVLLSQFYLSTNGYSLEQRKEFCLQLREKMEAVPGVIDVAYADGVPLGFEPSWWEDLEVEGYTPGLSENMKIFRNVVSPGYFELMRIPLIDGRDFTRLDDEKSHSVMIVNQTFARRFFGGANPTGRKVRGWGRWFTIVGEVKDSKYHYPGEAPLPYFYVAFQQIYRADMQLAFYVRTRQSPQAALATLRDKVREIDSNVTVFDAVPLAEFVGASLYPQKVAASLLSVLGMLAVLLAAVGLYGVMAYSVVQRTHEIGIRMALGARPADVLRLVVWQGLKMTVAGLCLGIALALAAARSVSALSFASEAMGLGGKLLAVSANDPLIYTGAAFFLTAVALLAAYIPAKRAAGIEPMEALRYE